MIVKTIEGAKEKSNEYKLKGTNNYFGGSKCLTHRLILCLKLGGWGIRGGNLTIHKKEAVIIV